MSNSNTLKIGFGIAVLTLSAVACVSIPVGTNSGGNGTGSGPACLAQESAQGDWAKFQSTGEDKAELAWRDKINGEHGFSYSHWDKAQNKSVPCDTNGHSGVLRLWRCTAIGQPCQG